MTVQAAAGDAGAPYIDTWVTYPGEIHGRARRDIPDPSRTNLVLNRQEVRVFDARPRRDELSFDREGFRLFDHRSTIGTATDMRAAGPAYLASVAELVKVVSGADLVIPRPHGPIKRHSDRLNVPGAVRPSRCAHMDFTPDSIQTWITWLESWVGLELRSHRRIAIFQAWRCLSPPPQDNTLVLCDASTLKADDWIPLDVCMHTPYEAPGNQIEVKLCPYDPAQRWWYFSNLTVDELIVFKSFDSTPGRSAESCSG